MLVCARCKKTIVRPSVRQTEGVSHGYCARCYVSVFATAPIEELSAELDRDQDLPFGRIVLDRELRVVYYSKQEAAISGLSPERVLGRLLFDDIAPCLNARQVGGWCKDHVDGDVAETTRVDWLMEFESGTRVASLTIAAGCGRVILEIEASPIESTHATAP